MTMKNHNLKLTFRTTKNQNSELFEILLNKKHKLKIKQKQVATLVPTKTTCKLITNQCEKTGRNHCFYTYRYAHT